MSVALGWIQVGVVFGDCLGGAWIIFICNATAAWKHVQVNEHCSAGFLGNAESLGHDLPLVIGRYVLVDGIPVGPWAASNKEKRRAVGDCRSELELLLQISSCTRKISVSEFHAVGLIENLPVLHEAVSMLKISTAVRPTLPLATPPTTTISETGVLGAVLTGPQAKPYFRKICVTAL